MSPSILMYGTDPHLLRSRQAVLVSGSYRVCTASDLPGVALALKSASYDLFILCHSLSRQECEQALVLTFAQWPTLKTLVLNAGMVGCQSYGDAEAFDIMRGPASLLTTVDHLTQPQSAEQQLCLPAAPQ